MAIVGMTVRSMRSMMPASSSRRNRSSSEVASAAACIVSAAMPRKIAGSGWTTARLIIHGSRGRTQQIASGSTPRASSQMQASVAVLPDPTTTYWLGASSSRARSLTGSTRASSPTPNGGRLLRGDAGRQVVGVDDPAPLGHLETLARDARDDGAVADVLAVGEELDLARLQHPVEHPRVVGADLRLGGSLLQALLGSALLQLAAAEQGRRDAVEGGGLMQADERVRLEPVPADAVATVDQRHADVGVVDQRVGERHPHGAGSHHEVVGFDRARHRSNVPLTPRRVHGAHGHLTRLPQQRLAPGRSLAVSTCRTR